MHSITAAVCVGHSSPAGLRLSLSVSSKEELCLPNAVLPQEGTGGGGEGPGIWPRRGRPQRPGVLENQSPQWGGSGGCPQVVLSIRWKRVEICLTSFQKTD